MNSREKSKLGIEIWKWIPGYKNLYKISNMGRIKSFPRKVKCGRGHRLHPKQPMLLAFNSGPWGHKSVTLCDSKRRRSNIQVHTLVMLAFVGPRPKGKEIRHFPIRNPGNNKLYNLSYSSHTVNIRDRSIHGTNCFNQGDKNGGAKLTTTQASKIKSLLNKGHRPEQIAPKFPISVSAVYDIAANRTWKHI